MEGGRLAKECRRLQKLKRQRPSLPSALGGTQPPTPCFWPQETDFRLLTLKVTHLCSLEPPSLWSSVPVALAHTHHICVNPQTFHLQGAESSPLL